MLRARKDFGNFIGFGAGPETKKREYKNCHFFTFFFTLTCHISFFYSSTCTNKWKMYRHAHAQHTRTITWRRTHRTHSTAKIKEIGKRGTRKTGEGLYRGVQVQFPWRRRNNFFFDRKNLIGEENNFLNTFTNSPNVGVANQKRPSYYWFEKKLTKISPPPVSMDWYI